MSPGSPAKRSPDSAARSRLEPRRGYERLKQASDPIAGHTRAVVSAIRSGSEVVSLSADPVRPEPPSPRTRGPAFEISRASRLSPSPRVPSLGFDPNSLGSPTRTAKRRPPLRASQQGCLRAFAGMTPVAMATATACVKFMQLNLWRAVSRYPFTLANDRFKSPAMS